MNKKYFIPLALIAGAVSMIGFQAFAQSSTSPVSSQVQVTSQSPSTFKIIDSKDTDQETNDEVSDSKSSDTDIETNDDNEGASERVNAGIQTHMDNRFDGETNDN